MERLSKVCIQLHLDYFRTRTLLLRGEIAGEIRGTRLYVDPADAARWKQEQESRERAGVA